MDKATVVAVRLPPAMLAAVDRLVRAKYLSRSEAVRALVRSGIEAVAPPWERTEDAPQPETGSEAA